MLFNLVHREIDIFIVAGTALVFKLYYRETNSAGATQRFLPSHLI